MKKELLKGLTIEELFERKEFTTLCVDPDCGVDVCCGGSCEPIA